ncbi:MAG TPA: hypothetical protein DIT64_03370 [Verrucomicrobiales bacterium]|nr:hypothetical protein [Verrucomicrobiales bacterium]
MKNERVPSRSKSAKDAADPASKSRIKDLGSRSRQLREEIHRLECEIAEAPLALTRHKLATRNTLPPLGPAARKPRQPKRKPLHQLRAERNRRLGLFIELALVLLVLAAAVGLMNRHFHWWT